MSLIRPPGRCGARSRRTSGEIRWPEQLPTREAFSDRVAWRMGTERPRRVPSRTRDRGDLGGAGRGGVVSRSPDQETGPKPGEAPRRWAVVDSTPGAEAAAWGTYISDGELLDISSRRASEELARLRCISSALMGATMRAARCAADQSLRDSPSNGLTSSGSAPTSEATGSHQTCSSSRRSLLRSRPALSLTRGRCSPRALGGRHRSPPRPGCVSAGRSSGPALREARRRQSAIADLEPLGSRTGANGDISVDLSHAGRTMTVTVRATVGETTGLLTCRATHPLHPPTFALQAIEVH